jgi:hypothetical protein
MPRFEYRIESFTHPHGVHNPTPSIAEFLARVNALGAEGWMVIPASGFAPGIVLLVRESRDAPGPNWDEIGRIGGVSGKPKPPAPGDA